MKARDHPWWRRAWEIIAWAVSSALLVLLPKCPVCMAAYLALATGLGISLATAWWVRTILVTLCIASLLYLLSRRMRSLKKAPR